MSASDIRDVKQLLEESPEASDWSEESIRSALESPQTMALVCEHTQQIVACIFGVKVADEAEILNLAVKTAQRRKGEATELVRWLLAEWIQDGVRHIFLEVRASNAAAIKLYERLGFRQVGRRKDYYSNPLADALVLERQEITDNPQIGTS